VEHNVATLVDFNDEGLCVVEVEGIDIVIFKLDDGTLTALEDRCSHADVKLSEGAFEKEGKKGGTIECFAHGAKFDVCSGKHLCMPAVTPVRTFPVRSEGESIFVTITAE
jgi:3-phenylpropionate/trans-cinnamate dioxygenase ferredoxin component